MREKTTRQMQTESTDEDDTTQHSGGSRSAVDLVLPLRREASRLQHPTPASHQPHWSHLPTPTASRRITGTCGKKSLNCTFPTIRMHSIRNGRRHRTDYRSYYVSQHPTAYHVTTHIPTASHVTTYMPTTFNFTTPHPTANQATTYLPTAPT